MRESGFRGPILYIFSGLPGSGKSTLSQLIARQLDAVYLRVDTIEQALRDICSVDVGGEGYRLAYRIAADNLRLGLSVVADSCNPIELTRREWEQVAREAAADHVNIEVICSAISEHRLRVETRASEVSGLRLPTWSEVENREYHDWTVDRVVVDTAGRSAAECASDLLSKLPRLRAFAESWRVTAVRTGSIAVAIGIGVGLYKRELAAVPLATVVALWFALGGHVLEVLFRNQLSRRIGGQPMRSIARLAYWFVGGSVLYAGALATLVVLAGRAPRPWPWWAPGVGFVGLELVVHQFLRARGQASFYNGLG